MKHYNCGPDNPNYGKPTWNRGISLSVKHRQKIGRGLVGNKNRLGIPHDDESKKKISRPGPTNGNWRGGRSISTDGYPMVFKPGHVRSCNGRYVCKHLLVAEAALGRPLILGKEVVHHINGDRSDCRPENLLICSKSYHYWLHARMAQLYQMQHFGRNTEPQDNIPSEAVKSDRQD